jgi:hypothetical protein
MYLVYLRRGLYIHCKQECSGAKIRQTPKEEIQKKHRSSKQSDVEKQQSEETTWGESRRLSSLAPKWVSTRPFSSLLCYNNIFFSDSAMETGSQEPAYSISSPFQDACCRVYFHVQLIK